MFSRRNYAPGANLTPPGLDRRTDVAIRWAIVVVVAVNDSPEEVAPSGDVDLDADGDWSNFGT